LVPHTPHISPTQTYKTYLFLEECSRHDFCGKFYRLSGSLLCPAEVKAVNSSMGFS
jgi:hypothetical protein